METPKWDMKLLAAKDVYEPAEDSFLLLDALESDSANLINFKPRIVLEVGPGSGIIISAIASFLKNSVYCLAADINPDACVVSKKTAELNDVNVDVINTDLLESFQLRGFIDVIIFNPPYVETTNNETSAVGISQSWAGGESGRKIINRLMPTLNKALSSNGIFYLVAISYNNVEELIEQMQTLGFVGVILTNRQIPGELLYVLKFTKVKDMVDSDY